MLSQNVGITEEKMDSEAPLNGLIVSFYLSIFLRNELCNYLCYDLVSGKLLEAELWRTLTEISSSAFQILVNSHSVE